MGGSSAEGLSELGDALNRSGNQVGQQVQVEQKLRPVRGLDRRCVDLGSVHHFNFAVRSFEVQAVLDATPLTQDPGSAEVPVGDAEYLKRRVERVGVVDERVLRPQLTFVTVALVDHDLHDLLDDLACRRTCQRHACTYR